MADLTIDDLWTFYDLNDPTKRLNAFCLVSFLPPSDPSYCDPFGIAFQVTSAYPMSADVRIQIANYRQDPTYGKMWFGPNGVRSTIDLDGDLPGLAFLKNTYLPGGTVLFYIWWRRYTDLFGPVGAGLLPAICNVRAQIQSGYFDTYAATPPDQWSYTFTVR
jgi:hypothetical protein